MTDEFLLAYQKQRMLEMMAKVEKLQFGKVINLDSADQFVQAIDEEDKSVTVIIHIYQNNVPGCEAMNGCLITLAKEYPYVKFCKISGKIIFVFFLLNKIFFWKIYKKNFFSLYFLRKVF